MASVFDSLKHVEKCGENVDRTMVSEDTLDKPTTQNLANIRPKET